MADIEKLAVAEIHPERLRAVDDAELLSVHRRLHQLFGAHFAGNDRLSAGDLNREAVVNAEVFVQAEMTRRGVAHAAADELAREAAALSKLLITPGAIAGLVVPAERPRDGVVVSPRAMADAILEGRKTLLVKTRPFALAGGRFLLLSGRLALGVVKFGDMATIRSLDALHALDSEHLINEATRRAWCEAQPGWCQPPFYAWPVRVVERFAAPRDTNVGAGPQVFVRDVVLKAEERKFADINPSGAGAHSDDPVTLAEVLSHFERPIALRKPAVFLVGSVCNQGVSANDLDILIRGPLDAETKHVVKFRLGRALPPRLSERVQFLDDDAGGPYTNHVPLYDLVLVPHAERRVIEMRADVAKQDDPLLDWPEPGAHRRPAVLQAHFRGASVHLDLRLQVRDYLVGWTLAAQRAGAVPDVDTIAEAKRIGAAFSVEGSRYFKPLRAPAKLFAASKSRQPVDWLQIDERVFPPGEVGATAEEQGVIVAIDRPVVSWGLQKPFSHEYFFERGKHLVGVMHFRLLPGGARPRSEEVEAGRETPAGETFWTAFLSKDLLPSVLERRAVETRSMPPDGQSALPPGIEREVPEALRYWKHTGAKARALRDELVAERLITEADLRLEDGEIIYAPQRTKRERSFGHAVAALVPRGASITHPLLATNWRAAISEGDAPGTMLVLSSPERIDVAALADAIATVKRAEWLVEVDDSSEAREALAKVGRPFTLAAAPERLLCSSRPGHELAGAEWIDVPEPEPIAKQPRRVRFTLSWQFWKGQTVVRAAPSRQIWHLLLERDGGLYDWQLAADPLSGEPQIAAVLTERSTKVLLDFDGDVAPGERVGGDVLNDTKATPSSVRVQDRGEVELLDDQPAFKKLRFHGAKLEGVFTLVAEEAGSAIWQFARGAEPGRAIPTEKAHAVETIALADGTKLEDVQVWDPRKIRPDDDKGGDRAKLRPLALYQPQKVAPRPTNEFRHTADLVERFAVPHFRHGEALLVEPKVNGFRCSLQKDDRGRMLLVTEELFDRATPIANLLATLPTVRAAAEKLPGPYVLDCEFTALDGDAPVPRRELARFRSADPGDDRGVRLFIFRALYLGQENLTQQSEGENRERLQNYLARNRSKIIVLAPARLARSEKELRDAVRWASREPGSEGAMVKWAGATYSLGGENDGWAKVKLAREVRAIVFDRHPVKDSPGVFNFIAAVGPIPKAEAEEWQETIELGGQLYTPVGRTFNSRLDAKPGDVIAVEVTEVLVERRVGEKRRVHWFTPMVLGKVDRAPMTVREFEALAEPGEIEKVLRVVEKREELRYVLGIVLEPDVVDAQRDTYTAETIRRAAWRFMEEFQRIGDMHRGVIEGARIVDNVIVPREAGAGWSVNGETLKPGTWLMGLHVVDDALWAKVKSGEREGLSMGGSARRILRDCLDGANGNS